MDDSQLALLRIQLVELLELRSAHLDLAAAFDDVEDSEWGATISGAPHTLFQLLEHTRIAARDLYVFATNPKYVTPDWPKDYWPGAETPDSADAAKQSLAGLKESLGSLIALAEDPEVDLFAKIPWGTGQTILRELMLAADHTSYHLGQAVFLRKQLQARR